MMHGNAPRTVVRIPPVLVLRMPCRALILSAMTCHTITPGKRMNLRHGSVVRCGRSSKNMLQ